MRSRSSQLTRSGGTLVAISEPIIKMKKIIEYVPVITVCLIYFGFCNLHSYYKEFKIDIYHYISNTEILLSFLPTIVLLASSLYAFAYSKILNDQNMHNDDIEIEDEKSVGEDKILKDEAEKNRKNEVESETQTKPKTKKNKIWKLLFRFPTPILLLFGIEALINSTLIKHYGFKNYELQDINLIYSFIFLVIIYFSSSLFKNPEIINENLLFITFFSVAYLGIQISNYRKLDADKIKAGIASKQITFKYNQETVTTSKENIYVGQTQTNLFIYNIKSKNTFVYKVENIDSLIIK